MNKLPTLPIACAGLLLNLACLADIPCLAQGKAQRAKPPSFDDNSMEDIFFTDVNAVLKGELPTKQTQLALQPSDSKGSPTSGDSNPSEDTDPLAWHKLVSPTSIEDLVKGSKLRLGQVITTPAAFASGGFEAARKEFSLQALLFAIIEVAPDEGIRFKKSAALARERMTRAAANTKVGSIQSFNEAKQRMLDLEDLVNGSPLPGDAKTEIDWSNLIDRVPLMRLLEWAQQDNLSKLASSEASFKSNQAELKRYSQLIAILGKASLQEDMPDATDDDYIGFSKTMIEQALEVALAVDTDNHELARKAAAQIGQSCQDCHENFR